MVPAFAGRPRKSKPLKKLALPLLTGALCLSFIAPVETEEPVKRFPAPSARPEISRAEILYEKMDLEQLGLSKQAFSSALQGTEKLSSSGKIERNDILTICDLSRSSAEKRMYIIDLAGEKLLLNTYVAHGKNSGAEFATKFSNTPESLQSSLGFYQTGQTYIGKHGLSLRLIGLDGKFNDKALERTIVLHGADYVNEGRLRNGGYMGRSWGCPAVAREESENIIRLIKGGTCFFIYYPSRDYLEGSRILND